MPKGDESAHELQQVCFLTPDGAREILWAERVEDSEFLIVSVPIFTFGVSVGTRVRAIQGSHPTWLDYAATVADSAGATTRLYVPEGSVASKCYHERVVLECNVLRLAIGPATFFDPVIVTVHLRRRTERPKFARYLDKLVDEGVLTLWEMGDPDTGAHEPDDSGAGSDLVHPLPHDPTVVRKSPWLPPNNA